MANFLYKKETFIYEETNSITNDLCKDIIEIYNNDQDKKKYENYDIDINSEYGKLKTFLMKELNKHICNYEKQTNKINNYKMINIKNTNFSFFIENNNNKENINYRKRISIQNKNNIKLFMYIWFLNDYDGEIIFWNDYRITPKCGKFIMFPISWCFPYHEIIHSDANKYILYGYIYI